MLTYLYGIVGIKCVYAYDCDVALTWVIIMIIIECMALDDYLGSLNRKTPNKYDFWATMIFGVW